MANGSPFGTTKLLENLRAHLQNQPDYVQCLLVSSVQWEMTSKIVIAVSVALATLVVAWAFAPEPETITITTPQIEECDLDCLVGERTAEIHERDQQLYRDQSRLKALIEIQDELHQITLDYNE